MLNWFPCYLIPNMDHWVHSLTVVCCFLMCITFKTFCKKTKLEIALVIIIMQTWVQMKKIRITYLKSLNTDEGKWICAFIFAWHLNSVTLWSLTQYFIAKIAFFYSIIWSLGAHVASFFPKTVWHKGKDWIWTYSYSILIYLNSTT